MINATEFLQQNYDCACGLCVQVNYENLHILCLQRTQELMYLQPLRFLVSLAW